jgi:hypothetical protein
VTPRAQLLDDKCFTSSAALCPAVTSSSVDQTYTLQHACAGTTQQPQLLDVDVAFSTPQVTTYFADACAPTFKVIAQGLPSGVSVAGLWRARADGTACATYTVAFLADNKPMELTWDLTGPNGVVIASGGPYLTPSNGTTVPVAAPQLRRQLPVYVATPCRKHNVMHWHSTVTTCLCYA